MRLERKTYDLAGLATDLLPSVKAQCRVDFADDDAFLEQAAGRAIGLIERTTSFAIAPAEWQWIPAGPIPGSGVAYAGPGGEGSNRCLCCLKGWQGAFGWQIPVCPVTKFSASLAPADGTDPIDCSQALEIAGVIDPSQFERQWLVLVDGGTINPGKVTVTLNAGFADTASMAPGVLDIVLRMTAYIYENREWAAIEGFDTTNTRQVQAYAASIGAGLWIPSC